LNKFQFKLVPSLSAETISSVVASLAQVVEALDSLEELDFEEDPVDYKRRRVQKKTSKRFVKL